MKYRQVGACLLIPVLSLSVIGCSSSIPADNGSMAGSGSAETTVESTNTGASKKEEATSNPVTLKLYTQEDDKSIIDEMITEYKSVDPNVTIDVTYIPASEYGDKILVYLSGQQDVDLVYCNTVSEYYNYASKGVLLELTDYIKRNNYDMSLLPPLMQDVTYNGGIYGLPYKRTSWFLYYNKDLFDKDKIPYPGQMTWSEFRDLAKKLTHGSGSSQQWGTYFVTWDPDFMALQRQVGMFSDDIEKSLRESWQFEYDLYYTDKSSMSLIDAKATQADWLATWEKGNVAMYVMGNWLVPLGRPDELAGKTNVKNYGVAPLPVPDDVEPGTTWGQGAYMAVAGNSTKKEEAARFLCWAAGPVGNSITAKNGFLPAIVDDNSKKALADYMGTDEYVNIMMNTILVPEFEPKDKMEQLRAICNEETNLYLMKEVSLDDAMSEFLKRREELLKN